MRGGPGSVRSYSMRSRRVLAHPLLRATRPGSVDFVGPVEFVNGISQRGGRPQPARARPPRAQVSVARHLTAERRGTSPHFFGNCTQAHAASHSRGYEVSFLLGALVIAHVATPVWPEGGSRSIPDAQLLKQVLHFGCESVQNQK